MTARKWIQFHWVKKPDERRDVDATTPVNYAIERLLGDVRWLQARKEPFVPIRRKKRVERDQEKRREEKRRKEKRKEEKKKRGEKRREEKRGG